MTLYFDTRVQNSEINSVNTFASWHSNLPLLAVAAFSQEKGGFVTVYDDQGEALPDVETTGHSVAQVTAISWHPERKWLAVTWESGELRVSIFLRNTFFILSFYSSFLLISLLIKVYIMNSKNNYISNQRNCTVVTLRNLFLWKN